ncbi:MAG: hypothetical protein U0228_22365 [Myxococcaceae bacterium]
MYLAACYESLVADYAFSSAYAEAIVRALKRSPRAAELEAKLVFEAKTMWDNPWTEQWQPAEVVERIGDAAVELYGEDVFENVTFAVMKDRFGPIVLPAIQGAVNSKSPGAVFKKLDTLVKVALKGVELQFKPEGELAGRLFVRYPRPVAKHVVTSWRGVAKFVFEVTSPGEIVHVEQRDPGDVLALTLQWPEPVKPAPKDAKPAAKPGFK